MYKVNFYHERYNMDPDYYTGNDDIDISASFEHWQDMINYLDLMIDTYEGETYSVWDGEMVLCGGAFDPSDKDIILENLGHDDLQECAVFGTIR